MATKEILIEEQWQDINWKTFERQVFRIQKRIYKASQSGNVKLVHRLQRLLTRSYYAKLLAMRRISQDNQGKKTAGVDGVKSLTQKQRLEMVRKLKLGKKVKPTRRVWIPKPELPPLTKTKTCAVSTFEPLNQPHLLGTNQGNSH
jgi:RNA-directed DNA polymerase